ncbi:MAG: glycosyltransferase family 39 protein [Anaerolineae bacterium]
MWWAAAITLLAFVLRIPFLERRTLTIDEASSLKYIAGQSPAYLLTHYHTTSHQLMSVLAHFIAGVGHWLTLYRWPAAAAGVLAVPITYALGRRMLGRRAGLLAALLLAAAPFHVDFSLQMRGYTLATLGATATYFCLWRGLSTGRRQYWLALAAASVVAMYAHLFAALAVGATWLIVAGMYLSARRKGIHPPWTRAAAVALPATALGLAALYGPILPRILATPDVETDWPTQIEPLVVAGQVNPDAIADYLKVFRLYGPLGEPRSWLVWSFVWLAGVGLLAALATHRTRRAGVFIAVWIFVPIAAVMFGLQFIRGFYAYRRFFMFFQPLYLLLLANGILAGGRRAGGRRAWARTGATAALIVVALAAAGWKLYHQTSEDTHNGWAAAAQVIQRESERPLVICEPYNRRMREVATHRDTCYRNLQFYLRPVPGKPIPWLAREVDEVASVPGVSARPRLAEAPGEVWLVLWQPGWPAPGWPPVPPIEGVSVRRAGSTLLLHAEPQAAQLLALSAAVDALVQIPTTPEDRFAYLLSQAQMKALTGRRDAARAALHAAQALSPPGIDAPNRLRAVAELIGMEPK